MSGDNGHVDEYHDALVDLLELIWGPGFMAPGGPGCVAKMVAGLDLNQCKVLDIGCGIGGPAMLLAQEYGARVVGIDLEAPLIERAQRVASQRGLDGKVTFKVVEAGPLAAQDGEFDVVYSAGAFTQVDDKLAMFKECRRVLKPGGILTCYDWTKSPGEYSEDMRYWFKMEGLTYAMRTLDEHGVLLEQAGFEDIQMTDASQWYRRKAREEYEQLKTELYPKMLELMPQSQADYFVENWRAMVVVCDKGEMQQSFYRARNPR